jgi:hypothetical protein
MLLATIIGYAHTDRKNGRSHVYGEFREVLGDKSSMYIRVTVLSHFFVSMCFVCFFMFLFNIGTLFDYHN